MLVLYLEALMSMIMHLVLKVPGRAPVRMTVYMYVPWSLVNDEGCGMDDPRGIGKNRGSQNHRGWDNKYGCGNPNTKAQKRIRAYP